MENLGRGERMVRIFVYLMAHYNNHYSVTDIMQHLDIPASELRSVQRDMQALINIPGDYIERYTEFGKVYYQANVPKADKLVFPEFSDTLLHLVFLKRVANIYPASASLVNNLTTQISGSLPKKSQDTLSQLSSALNNRILFMGSAPGFDEASAKNLYTFLRAICEHRKVQVRYTDNWGNFTDKVRIPLMIVMHQGDIYVGCTSQSHAGATYTLKLCRVESVKLTQEQFIEDAKVLEALRARIRAGALLLGEQSPKSEEVVILFEKQILNTLKEHPYHQSMHIEERKNDLRVTMKVEVNDLLKQWVMYYGNIATVKQPEELKRMIRETAKKLVEKYEK
ncbi:YafY family protein [Fibrobacter sp. UWB11]|uniref:helix-turn-helix transcriptional regulator n=1 Tax=Fibrobacter sp. UWB11 TaxID=1896202 RepID=UPI0009276246|nr:WYL domain-containing protein [Fibrobacter sp. UWB11]SIO39495.1 Predicted DNA-binding transcriptional regulator YafY, contains an HTH and WYL domains [Fibrobacter sp. UWB11]